MKHIPKTKLLLLLGDVFLIYFALFLSPPIRFGILTFDLMQPLYSWGEIFILGIYILTFYLADLYDINIRFKSLRYLLRLLVALYIASAFVMVVFFFIPALTPGRGVFLVSVGLIGLLTYSWRLVFEWVFRSFLERQKRILIVGAGWAGHTLYELVKDNPVFKVVGFIDDDHKKHGVFNSPAVLGDYKILNEMVREHKVDSVVIAITHLKSLGLLKSLLDCKMKGVQVYDDMPSFYEEVTGKIPVEHVSDFWFVSTPISGMKKNIYNMKAKRMFDIVFSITGILVSLPFIILTAIAIKRDSKGTTLYRQERVGFNGETFSLIKFRSMRADAEKDGVVWADKADSRVTRVGKIIRKLRIDEIPQMWNVLKGEMSFIGPRPERPEFVKILEKNVPYYSLRHSVKPGITGWAQVNYSYGASEKDALEKLQYDLFYINNLSPFLDFRILLKSMKVVLFGRGAR